MKKSKLFVLFSTFNSKEIRALNKFVRSPYFNTRPAVIALSEYLEKSLQKKKYALDKTAVFKVLFPKAKYNDIKLRLVMSELYQLLEKFLLVQDFLEDDNEHQLRLVQIYRQRELSDYFERSLKKMEQAQEKKQLRDDKYYDDQYHMELEKYQYISRYRPTDQLNLQKITDDLDLTYLARKLKSSCLQLSQQNIYTQQYDTTFIAQLSTYIQERGFLQIPLIAVHYNCYMSLLQPQEKQYFDTFKALLFEHSKIFSAPDFRDLLLLAINYCIKKLNEGNTDYFTQVFTLYQEGVEKKYLIENKMISRFTYSNIVSTGLITGHDQWVEQFINDFKSALDPKYQKAIYYLSLAQLYYYRKDFDQALVQLRESNFDDILLNLKAKTIRVKIYYELNELNALDAHLDSMQIFIRRKKVLGYHRTNYLNFVKFTKKLTMLNPYVQSELKELIEAIKLEETLTEKSWLLAQVQ